MVQVGHWFRSVLTQQRSVDRTERPFPTFSSMAYSALLKGEGGGREFPFSSALFPSDALRSSLSPVFVLTIVLPLFLFLVAPGVEQARSSSVGEDHEKFMNDLICS